MPEIQQKMLTVFTYTSKDIIDFVRLINMKESYNMCILDFYSS